jgi:hypothetical protein
MKKLLIISLLITGIANAQDSTWKKFGDYSLSGNYIHVNSVKQQILNTNIMQDFTKKGEYHQFFVNYILLKKDSLLISNDLNIKYQHKKNINNWNYYNYVIYSTLKSRSVLNREEIGLGIGKEVIKKRLFRLNLSIALDYSNTEYKFKYENKTVDYLRLSNRIHAVAIFPNFTVNTEVYIQPDIKDFNNLNYNWIIKMNIPVYKNFLFNLSSVRTFETYNPNLNNSNMNDNFLIGLTYKY